MNLQAIVAEAFFAGLALAILWVVLWALLVPEIPFIPVWQGYESIVPHIFVFGFLAYIPAKFLLRN